MSMTEAIRVAVADDHPMFRAGVVSSLGEEENIDIVGEASDAPSALALARSELPDVMILDIAMLTVS
jgi:two-component system nitrate/nitrite response regulator NarL